MYTLHFKLNLKKQNMKLSKLLLIAPIALASSYVTAQTHVDNTGKINMYSKKAESESAQGSQYFIDKFNPAHIGDLSDVSLVRYNAYKDEMEIKVNDAINVLQPIEKQAIKLINGTATYEYITYTDKEGVENQHFLIIISENPNLKIFKRERITLIPEQHPAGGYQKYKAPQYKKLDPEYYIQMNGGTVTAMSTRKSDIIALVPAKQSEVKDFIKTNKISTDEDADLKKLGAYLNTLL